MTEQSSAPPHLDLDALADTLAGEGSGADHLASCGSCTSRLAELTAAEARVTAVLATLPPPPMPDGLAERLSAAIAAEAPLRAQASTTVTPLPSREPRRRWLPAAAAAVLLASGAGIGYAVLEAPGGNDEGASTAAGADLVLNASGTDYGDEAAVAAVLPQVLQGAAGGEVSAGSVPDTARSESDSADSAAADSGAGGTSQTQSDAAATMQAPAMAFGEDPLARLRTADGLADCLSALVPPEEPDLQPLALDYAQFQGAPALAVVLPDPDPAKVSVFVVGPACAQGNEDLLKFLRVDAP